ncbi:hypothetical protein [Candidatus Proelusimicrobium excrementi]|uniref:hypothetical protein n=1 Tax=Candidatus Proelusimicrobium excrementi TaxID=3416222 RepID=UPI003CAF0145|nr:hypothetical protein [Elusimicrobiaceae bacterium]
MSYMTHNGRYQIVTKNCSPDSFIKETKKLWGGVLGRNISTEQALQIIEFWLGFAGELGRLSQLPSASK